ncbi:hypothetical protein F5884DRAFT_360135 [Xylogone sp. PMI_703]|nr:hypothetical protein F5884DRAFT_360135 [Xylogone sp. PMI_703]
MLFSQASPALLSLLVTLSSLQPALAGPYPKDDLHDIGYSFLQVRDCVAYCGVYNQYCCTAGQACYTDTNTVAFCGAATPAPSSGGGSGQWVYYTSVFTETDLVVHTSVYSSFVGGAPTTNNNVQQTSSPAICDTSVGQTSCGPICCSSSQRCAASGQCEDAPPGGWTSWTYTASNTGTFVPPTRPTSGTASTATVAVTTTEPFGTAVSATSTSTGLAVVSTGGGGLSGGAIAGIVIGTIAGVILLLLICFCCILRAGWDGLLAIFGLGNRRRETVTEVETIERYRRGSSHGGAASRRTHTGWFGAASGGGRRRPTTVVEERKRKSSGFGGLGAVGAGLLGLAVVLGLKRRHDRKEREKYTETDISSSYYTDSYTGTSASSASSDRRTRDDRRGGTVRGSERISVRESERIRRDSRSRRS